MLGGKGREGKKLRRRVAEVLAAAVALLTFTGLVSGDEVADAQSTRRGPGGCVAQETRHAGHYYLNGVMEVGSELLLRPDGSFEFMLAYGANDQYGRGCWVARGGMVEVIPAGRRTASLDHTPDSGGFSGLVLTVSGRDLVWDINGSGHKGRYRRG